MSTLAKKSIGKQHRLRHGSDRPTDLQWELDTAITVVLFAGLGGACQGLEEAGCPVHVANNHDDVALAAHAELHPHTTHVRGDIFDVDPLKATKNRPVKVLWASPDCFPAGSLVLTSKGLKAIELVSEGEFVLTHRGRWRRVLKTMNHEAETVSVKGYGHYGLVTTPRHLFYSKRITKRWDAKASDGRRLGVRRNLVENPYWPEAADMEGRLWATPRVFPAAAMPQGAGVEFSDDFFYFLGRWIGDGSLNKGDVEICCGKSEEEELANWLRDHPLRSADGDVIEYRLVDRGTTTAFVWGCADLSRWLPEQAGVFCHGKRIPFWCLSMQRKWREALLRGYVAADGWEGRRTSTRTVSKELAIGVRMLATTLDRSASLYFIQGGREGEIDGRKFIERDIYEVRWTEGLQQETTFSDSLHRFQPVREVVPASLQLVYALQVEEDESLVVDGIVVHNCRDHSVAKGGAPRSPRVRSLPWQVCRWAGLTRPQVIFVENVREIRGWGPLVAKRCKLTGRVVKVDGTVAAKGEVVPVRQQSLVRDNRRAGRSYRAFVTHLRGLGYAYEDRDLNCADFGIPTSRRRFFAVARRDGHPICWPERTHAPRDQAAALGLLPWVAASTIIDWSIPLPSIFDRAKPLVEATQHRLAVGIRRFVIGNAQPFLLPLTHQGGVRLIDSADPMPTLTTAHRGEHAVAAPALTKFRAGSAGASLQEPCPTITANGHSATRPGCAIPIGVTAAYLTEHRGRSTAQDLEEPIGAQTQVVHHAVSAAYMVQTGYGERPGQKARVLDLEQPIGTQVTGGGKHAICAAWMAQHNSGVIGHTADEPVSTLTVGASQQQVAGAMLVKYYRSEESSQTADEPLHTVTTKARFGVAAVKVEQAPFLVKLRGTSTAQDARDPIPTLSAGGNHVAAAAALLERYRKPVEPELGNPAIISITGIDYVLADIGMRMLEPHEAAAAHELTLPKMITINGKRRALTKTEAMRLIGNSVPKPMARLLAQANAAHTLYATKLAAD